MFLLWAACVSYLAVILCVIFLKRAVNSDNYTLPVSSVFLYFSYLRTGLRFLFFSSGVLAGVWLSFVMLSVFGKISRVRSNNDY